MHQFLLGAKVLASSLIVNNMSKIKSFATRNIKHELVREPINYTPVEYNDGDGNITLVDPREQNVVYLDDFKLNKLKENGVNLNVMPMIGEDNLSAAEHFDAMYNDFINLEKQMSNEKSES